MLEELGERGLPRSGTPREPECASFVTEGLTTVRGCYDAARRWTFVGVNGVGRAVNIILNVIIGFVNIIVVGQCLVAVEWVPIELGLPQVLRCGTRWILLHPFPRYR